MWEFPRHLYTVTQTERYLQHAILSDTLFVDLHYGKDQIRIDHALRIAALMQMSAQLMNGSSAAKHEQDWSTIEIVSEESDSGLEPLQLEITVVTVQARRTITMRS